MSLDYTIYYEGSESELNDILSDFKNKYTISNQIFIGKINSINPINLEILEEYGFSGQYQSKVLVSLRKEENLKAKNTFKMLISEYFDDLKIAVLFNGEPIQNWS